MSKILARTGISLADVYDVEGSVAGFDELVTSEVQAVHEMGNTIFSERLSAGVRRRTAGAIAQSTNWDQVIPASGIDAVPASRIMGMVVVSDVAARISHCNASIRDPIDGRELPLFLWDATTDRDITYRADEDGGGVANIVLLQPATVQPVLPAMLVRVRLGRSGLTEITFRGRTTAFGAGTVTPTLLFTTCQPITDQTVPSNEGLPLPSW